MVLKFEGENHGGALIWGFDLPLPHSRQPKELIDFLKEKFEVRDSNAEFRIPNNQIQVNMK